MSIPIIVRLSRNYVLGGNSPRVPHTSAHLPEALRPFVLHHLFIDVCIAHSIGRQRQCFLWGRVQDYLLSKIIKIMSSSEAKAEQICQQLLLKYWGFLNSGLLSVNANPLYVQHPPEPASISPSWDLGARRTKYT